MSIFRFEYSMRLDFSAPCREHAFLLKCCPKDNRRQKILSFRSEIEPAHKEVFTEDWAGNRRIYGSIHDDHTFFSVKTEGEAETYASFFEEEERTPCPFYRYPSSLTQAGERIRALGDRVRGTNAYEIAHSAMRAANGSIAYRAGSTNVHTSAEEALARGSGVCQDYAHIFLALLRLRNIPCRYVAGLAAGSGLSHAWAEVNCNGYWYAFDPTANRLVGDGYLKFSNGRDSYDCAINRGSFTGVAAQTQTVSASMYESGLGRESIYEGKDDRCQ